MRIEADVRGGEAEARAAGRRFGRAYGEAAEAAAGNRELKIPAVPDFTGFRARLRAILAQIEAATVLNVKVDLKNATARIDVDTAGAIIKILEVIQLLNFLDGRVYRVRIDVDRRQLADVTRLLGQLGGAAGGASGSVGSLGSSFGSLGSAASTGAGAVAIAIAVVAALPAVIGLVATALLAIPATLTLITAGVAAVALGMDGIKKAAEVLTPALDTLKSKVSAVFERELTPVLQRVADVLLPGITAGMERMAGALSGVARGFVNVLTSSANMEVLNRILEQSARFMEELGPTINLATKSFLTLADHGSRALSGVADVLNQFAVDFESFIQRVSGDGSLDRAFDGLNQVLGSTLGLFLQLMDSGVAFMGTVGGPLAGFIDNLSQMFADLTPVMGQASAELLKMAGDALPQLTPAFKDLIPLLPDLAKSFLDILVAVAPLIPPLVQIASAFLKLVTPVVQLISLALTPLLRLLGKIAEPLLFIVSVLTLVAAALAVAFFGTPIIAGIAIVIAAVVALGYILTHFNTILEALKVATFAVRDALITAWNAVRDAVILALTATRDFIVMIWTEVSEFVVGVGTAIRDFFVMIWTEISDFVTGVTSTIRDAIVNAWNTVRDAVVAAVTAVRDAVVNAFNTARDIVATVLGAIIGAVTGGFNTVVGIARSAMGQLVGAISSMVGAAGSAARSVLSAVTGVFSGLGGLLVGAGKAVIEGFISGIGSMFGKVKGKLGDLKDSLTSWKGPKAVDLRLLIPAGHWIIDGFIDGIQDRVAEVRKTLAAISDLVAAQDFPALSLPDAVGGALADQIDAFAATTRSAVNSISQQDIAGELERRVAALLNGAGFKVEYDQLVMRLNAQNAADDARGRS